MSAKDRHARRREVIIDLPPNLVHGGTIQIVRYVGKISRLSLEQHSRPAILIDNDNKPSRPPCVAQRVGGEYDDAVAVARSLPPTDDISPFDRCR